MVLAYKPKEKKKKTKHEVIEILKAEFEQESEWFIVSKNNKSPTRPYYVETYKYIYSDTPIFKKHSIIHVR